LAAWRHSASWACFWDRPPWRSEGKPPNALLIRKSARLQVAIATCR
jgi:hypothetical protein